MSVLSKWRVIINGLEFAQHASPTQKRYWSGAVRGLGKGDIRTTSMVNSGTDGGYVGEQFLGIREIPLDLFVYSNDLQEVEDLAREFSNLTPLNETIDLRFITPRNKTYFVRGAKVADCPPEISDVQNVIDYKLTVISGDAVFYDVTGGDYEEVSLHKEVVGGIGWTDEGIDWSSTGIEWDDGQPNAIASNTGSVPAYPMIIITGKVTNPVFTNKTTGRQISLNISTGSSNVIAIDHLNNIVVLDPTFDSDGNISGGTNIYNNLNATDFWSLARGDNEIIYTSSSSGDTATIILRWNNGYTEIL